MSSLFAGQIKTIVLIRRNINIQQILLDVPFVRRILSWSRRYSPPGFSGISLFDTIHFLVQEVKKDNLTTRANSVAYSLFLSIFPATIFIFALLPLFPIVKDYTVLLSDQLRGVIPKSAHDYIFSIIYDITSIHRDGLLSAGALLALYFSSNGMETLMSGFDKAYHHTFKPRPWYKRRLVAIMLTVVLTILLIVSLIMVVLEDRAIEWLRHGYQLPEMALFLIAILNGLFAIVFVYTGISLIYTFGPSMHRRIPFINVGSIIATFLSLATSLAFSYFINNFGRYNELYGSIGALMVVLVWIQLNSFIILVGFELNASISVHKSIRFSLSKKKEP